MVTHSDRDATIRSRADFLGVVLTVVIVILARALGREWLLLPAGCWSVILLVRLIATLRRGQPGGGALTGGSASGGSASGGGAT
jgi:uncharacterized membrane protein YgcG